MRLDKYLKVSRIIKRRSIAKQLADEDRVLVNGLVAKPASNIELGDIIEIKFEHRHIKLKVTHMSEKMYKNAPNYYELIEDVKVKAL